jgi:hypothetical protein
MLSTYDIPHLRACLDKLLKKALSAIKTHMKWNEGAKFFMRDEQITLKEMVTAYLIRLLKCRAKTTGFSNRPTDLQTKCMNADFQGQRMAGSQSVLTPPLDATSIHLSGICRDSSVQRAEQQITVAMHYAFTLIADCHLHPVM